MAEPITAYRVWHIEFAKNVTFTIADVERIMKSGVSLKKLSAPRLMGVGVAVPWHLKEMKAICTSNSCKSPPNPICACGIWGIKEYDDLAEVLARYGKSYLAYGEIKMWGRIVETERGYRAEYAEPTLLYVRGLNANDRRAMADAYDCEVREETKENVPRGRRQVQIQASAHQAHQAQAHFAQAAVQAGAATAAFVAWQQTLSTVPPPYSSAPVPISSAKKKRLPYDAWAYAGAALSQFVLAVIFDSLVYLGLGLACFAIFLLFSRIGRKLLVVPLFLAGIVILMVPSVPWIMAAVLMWFYESLQGIDILKQSKTSWLFDHVPLVLLDPLMDWLFSIPK